MEHQASVEMSLRSCFPKCLSELNRLNIPDIPDIPVLPAVQLHLRTAPIRHRKTQGKRKSNYTILSVLSVLRVVDAVPGTLLIWCYVILIYKILQIDRCSQETSSKDWQQHSWVNHFIPGGQDRGQVPSCCCAADFKSLTRSPGLLPKFKDAQRPLGKYTSITTGCRNSELWMMLVSFKKRKLCIASRSNAGGTQVPFLTEKNVTKVGVSWRFLVRNETHGTYWPCFFWFVHAPAMTLASDSMACMTLILESHSASKGGAV